LVPNLYGPEGLTLPSAFHRAHFQGEFQSNFRPFNAALAGELTRLPLASPASGFTHVFDSAAGVFTASAQSFGPILTERAETIGRGRFFLGMAFQRFSFSKVDGIDLDDVPVVFQHERELGEAFENDFITTANSIDLTLNQFTIFATVGLTNRIDVSVAVPLLDVNLDVRSNATIHRTAPPNPQFGEAHFFDPANRPGSTSEAFRSAGSATGIGDVKFRLKGTVKRWESSALAIAADLRTPTGDERDFLGAGTFGFKPFIAYSLGLGRVAPHFNLGYEFNGSSVLAGDIASNRKGHLPNNLLYAAGVDIGASRSVTVALDFMGQRVFNGARAFRSTFTAAAPELSNPSAGPPSLPSTSFHNESYDIATAATGVKWSPAPHLLLTGNLLFRLNDSGLTARVVPLVGVAYTFR
jgi:hypothetical protein